MKIVDKIEQGANDINFALLKPGQPFQWTTGNISSTLMKIAQQTNGNNAVNLNTGICVQIPDVVVVQLLPNSFFVKGV